MSEARARYISSECGLTHHGYAWTLVQAIWEGERYGWDNGRRILSRDHHHKRRMIIPSHEGGHPDVRSSAEKDGHSKIVPRLFWRTLPTHWRYHRPKHCHVSEHPDDQATLNHKPQTNEDNLARIQRRSWKKPLHSNPRRESWSRQGKKR